MPRLKKTFEKNYKHKRNWTKISLVVLLFLIGFQIQLYTQNQPHISLENTIRDIDGNVYKTEDIVSNSKNPLIIAKYNKNVKGDYQIPEFGL